MSWVPIVGIMPPGGFHFVDKSGGVEVTITGSDYADVAKNVLLHRLRNGKPPGNPLQEVHDYVCSNWRHFCRDADPPVLTSAPGASLAARTAEWMGRFVALSGPDEGVDQKEATRRACICAGCPKNQNYRGGCTSCVESVNRESFVYLRNRSTPHDHALGACMVLGEHLPTSVWSTKLGTPTDNFKNDLPDNCWRR